ncbi:hypothetical protein [Streptomyces sp.]|uniref:hypothetical protein n=1 Tax=Streptomyces sp. TaxID=1931 RepID=UPI002F40282D
MTDEPLTEDTMVAALLREREGLVQRGLTDRVAQVDEQLALRGYKAPRGRAPKAAQDKTPTAEPSRSEAPAGRHQRETEKS